MSSCNDKLRFIKATLGSISGEDRATMLDEYSAAIERESKAQHMRTPHDVHMQRGRKVERK